MHRETVLAIARWWKSLGNEDPLHISFHGGEPLVPGIQFYQMALPVLREGLDPCQVSFGMQSNLWLLTDELCQLFCEYGLSLGTSLDGPEMINDLQRGPGYFRRTMNGIERARTHSMNVGCICTFTAQSAAYVDQVFDFFVTQRLGFGVHAALTPLGHSENDWMLSPEAHGQLLIDVLDRYLNNTDKIRISTLDAMCRSVSGRRGELCTFRDCLGEYLAIDPEGWIYPCQRFTGMSQHRMGNVHDCPTMDDLAASPVWKMFQKRQERVAEECGHCHYLDFCRGGCPYNVLVADGGSFQNALRDPHCPAYKRAFDRIIDRALEEVFSEENLTAVLERGPSKKYGLKRKGKLLQIMRGGPHPQRLTRRARETVAAVALAVSETPKEALHKLDCAGLITRPELALSSLQALRNQLDSQSHSGLVNAYIHVTYACNLHCTHCYASSPVYEGQETLDVSPAMAVNDVMRLVWAAAEAGFRKTVITGGEPLVHPQRNALLDSLAALRRQVKPMQTVLRTNLAYPLTPELAGRLGRSTDQVVVSLDGDQASHDARRGIGTYACVLANLFNLTQTFRMSGNQKSLALTAVLTAEQINGQEGDAVRATGKSLGLRVRLKSVLPLGRGRDLGLRSAFYSSLDNEGEALAYGSWPVATCGLGMNLYIAPEGGCYPCYALTGSQHYLGNALEEGLPAILVKNDSFRCVTVDSNPKCHCCALRYICGGPCRAWNNSTDPDAISIDCTALHKRACDLLLDAMELLNIEEEQWLAAGLPLPESQSQQGQSEWLGPDPERRVQCRSSVLPTSRNSSPNGMSRA